MHRRDELRASQIMQDRAKSNPKIEFMYSSEVVEASGTKLLESLKVKNLKTGQITQVPANGLFFAIGHDPATAFLNGQVSHIFTFQAPEERRPDVDAEKRESGTKEFRTIT